MTAAWPFSEFVNRKKSCPRSSIWRAASSGPIGFIVNRFVFTIRSPSRSSSSSPSDVLARTESTPDPPRLRRPACDLVLDLVDDEIERGGRLRGRGVRLHEVALQVDDDVAHLVVGDTGVAQLREVDFDAARVVRELGDLVQLVARELPEPGRDGPAAVCAPR